MDQTARARLAKPGPKLQLSKEKQTQQTGEKRAQHNNNEPKNASPPPFIISTPPLRSHYPKNTPNKQNTEAMASEKVETIVAGNYVEMERETEDTESSKSNLSKLFWHGGSAYDAWFSCSSNQVLPMKKKLYSYSYISHNFKHMNANVYMM